MSKKRTVNPAVVEAFDALAARLARPESWIKKAFARTARRGREVDEISDMARCWCLQGAIWALPSDAHIPISAAFIKLLPSGGEKNPITLWNDARGRTHSEVLDVIARAKAAYVAGDAS